MTNKNFHNVFDMWLIVSLFLVACGGDSGANSGRESSERDVKSYKTEDDMPNCSSKNEYSLAFIEADSVVQVCKNSRWEILGHPYASEDALPNCSKKHEDEKAYLMEEDEVQVCNDGVWSVMEEKPKSSNDSKSDNGGEINSSDSQNPKSDDSEDTKPDSSDAKDSGSSTKSSTSAAPGVTEGTFTDPRDGQKYRTVKIGNQEWFAENLNYDAGDDNSRCPLDKESYCQKYGRLYKDANHANCPTGWHVPFEVEWNELFAYVADNNGGEGVGKSLKASSGWYEVNYTVIRSEPRVAVATGDDLFRFSALPAGSCWENKCYSDDDAHFQSITKNYKIPFDMDVIDSSSKGESFSSIRCIKTEQITDAISKSVVIEGIEVTSENLTHGGSDIFNVVEATFACPSGWRLPTTSEMRTISSSPDFELDLHGKTNTTMSFYTSDGFCVVYCYDDNGETECSHQSWQNSPEFVRCVKE